MKSKDKEKECKAKVYFYFPPQQLVTVVKMKQASDLIQLWKKSVAQFSLTIR